ncbi:MAG: efflux RND transporter periplasmic adaptor subunit [Pseudomonadota bacterium]
MVGFGGCVRPVLLVSMLLLAGCGEEPPQEEERVRAIKPYYVIEPAGGDVRRFSGTIVAAETSALSFSYAGTVQTVDVTQGDRVVKGQVLATLDPEPFDLDVQAAESELASAKAEFQNATAELDRQRQLFDRGWVAKAAYDKAVTAYESAEGTLSLMRSRLGIAERDRTNAKLTAPFDGVIAARDVEPFVEVSPGQTVFQLDSDGAFEVNLSVPDKVVRRLAIGAPLAIDVRTVPGCGCTGRISEIGAASSEANAVSVTGAVLQGASGLLSGMAAEVGVQLASDGGPSGLLVPLVAIAAGDEAARGYVFKYDADEGVVRKTPIKGSGSIDGNLVAVTEGVDAGDIVAAAGVSFLRDGQRVKLMGE